MALIGAAAAQQAPSEIVGATWEWVSLTTPGEEVIVDAPERYTLQLGEDGRTLLRADCNTGGGSYSVKSGNEIAFGPIALTRMACAEGSLSSRFVQELERATTYFTRDGDLYLELPADSGRLRLRRQR
jgi:heat shock protein HslJ